MLTRRLHVPRRRRRRLRAKGNTGTTRADRLPAGLRHASRRASMAYNAHAFFKNTLGETKSRTTLLSSGETVEGEWRESRFHRRLRAQFHVWPTRPPSLRTPLSPLARARRSLLSLFLEARPPRPRSRSPAGGRAAAKGRRRRRPRSRRSSWPLWPGREGGRGARTMAKGAGGGGKQLSALPRTSLTSPAPRSREATSSVYSSGRIGGGEGKGGNGWLIATAKNEHLLTSTPDSSKGRSSREAALDMRLFSPFRIRESSKILPGRACGWLPPALATVARRGRSRSRRRSWLFPFSSTFSPLSRSFLSAF